ncbi:MAG: hypothetical protein IJR47_01495 [Clostridia bacterium]|nr:hypothetical protein [Clostridia bacterium]
MDKKAKDKKTAEKKVDEKKAAAKKGGEKKPVKKEQKKTKLFNSAIGGFNKKEVQEYIKAEKANNEKTVKQLNAKIIDLEQIIRAQYAALKEKNDLLTDLTGKLESFNRQNGAKLNEISQVIDSINSEKFTVNNDFIQKENEYKQKINALSSELSSLRAGSLLNRQSTEDMEKLQESLDKLQQLRASEQREFSNRFNELKSDFESRLSTVQKNHLSFVNELNKEHEMEIENINKEYAQELKRIESENNNALGIAKEDVLELKASLENAKNMESDARRRAESIIAEAQEKCRELIRKTEEDLAGKKAEAMVAIDREREMNRNELRLAYAQIKFLMDSIEDSRNQFFDDFSKIKDSLPDNF